LTFVATLNVIELVGATPVLADIDRHTLQIRVDHVARRIGPRTRAIIPVHFVGQPVDLDPLLDLARAHDLVLIEDAAHAAGTEYRGRRIGSFPTTSVFSFHPNKNITTGEGGMVVSHDEDVMSRVTLLKFHGLSRDAWKRFYRASSTRSSRRDGAWPSDIRRRSAGSMRSSCPSRCHTRRATRGTSTRRCSISMRSRSIATRSWPSSRRATSVWDCTTRRRTNSRTIAIATAGGRMISRMRISCPTAFSRCRC